MQLRITSKYFAPFDPEDCVYSPSQLEKISGATRRQVGEWIRRGILTAPNKSPGRGNSRSYSFWNLMEAIIAVEYGKIAQMQVLADSINELRSEKEVVFAWFDEELPQVLEAENIPNIVRGGEHNLYALISVTSATTLSPSLTPTICLATDKEGIMSILPKAGQKQAFPGIKIFRLVVPPVEVSVNLTWVFFKTIECEINLRIRKNS